MLAKAYKAMEYGVDDKGNYVVLMKSSILGESNGPNELVNLACTFTA